MYKNQTPQQLAVNLSLYSLLFGALIGTGLKLTGVGLFPWWQMLVVLLLVFVGLFFINYYFIRHYVFRRIKLIYKIIHKHKMPAEMKASLRDGGKLQLGEVESEVNEWALEQEKELEEYDRLAAYRRRFLGDVSHELKTPIFNIQGFIHTLLDGAINDPSVNINYLQRAAKNAERLESIIEDLETINRLESGQMVLDLREFNLRDLTDEVLADLEMRARERNIKLEYKQGAAHPFRVLADKESLRMVLMNLVQNSIKYGREGGTTKISFYDMESYILVEISDNGIGIAPEHLKHVFERFYRVDKSRSRDAGGTGLGLSIVKHIIEAHSQKVTVRSTLEKGSTFGFTVSKV